MYRIENVKMLMIKLMFASFSPFTVSYQNKWDSFGCRNLFYILN